MSEQIDFQLDSQQEPLPQMAFAGPTMILNPTLITFGNPKSLVPPKPATSTQPKLKKPSK